MHFLPSCFMFFNFFFLWTPCICRLHVLCFFFPLNTMHLWSSCFMIFIYLFIPSFECHAFVIFMFHVIYLFLSSFEHHAFEVVDLIHDSIDSFYFDARLMTMASMIIGVRFFYVISRFFLGVHFFFFFFENKICKTCVFPAKIHHFGNCLKNK